MEAERAEHAGEVARLQRSAAEDMPQRATPDDPNQLLILARTILGIPLAIATFIWAIIQGVARALKAISRPLGIRSR